MEHEKSSHQQTGHKHEALIQHLFACVTACESCAAFCLDEQDVTPMAHCIELNRDCAEVCSLAAKLLIRESEFSHEFLVFCEKISRHCAQECGKHEYDYCKKCADECIKCADACNAHYHGKVESVVSSIH